MIILTRTLVQVMVFTDSAWSGKDTQQSILQFVWNVWLSGETCWTKSAKKKAKKNSGYAQCWVSVSSLEVKVTRNELYRHPFLPLSSFFILKLFIYPLTLVLLTKFYLVNAFTFILKHFEWVMLPPPCVTIQKVFSKWQSKNNNYILKKNTF